MGAGAFLGVRTKINTLLIVEGVNVLFAAVG